MSEFDDMLSALDKSTMVTITDADGKLLYVNELFCHVTQYSKDELIGAKPHELLNSGYHDQAFYDDVWNTLKNGNTWKGDVKNKAKDGSFFWTLTTIMPFLDDAGKPHKYIAIRRDITDKVVADERLKVSLAENVMQKDKIQDQYGKLQDLQKEKEEFVAMITHDLKQPLVPIQGNAQMLLNPKMGELNEMQKGSVNEILGQANLQLSMIDNLVSAQKLGAGSMKYDIEELSTKNILTDCIKIHSPIMTDKHIEYFDSSIADVKILADRRRLLESLTNLIQNAHDFVPQDGKIEIGVNNDAKEATFFVKDNGEGIPKEKQERLFKKYGQVESTAQRKFGGTGLGLAVSKELIEGMKGKIWLESEVGKGTTFLFTIPKAE